jgi:hypothetical protein
MKESQMKQGASQKNAGVGKQAIALSERANMQIHALCRSQCVVYALPGHKCYGDYKKYN